MATYVNDLRLKEIATGDESGTWGTSTNTNLELIAEAFSFGTEAITTNADTHTTTIADGSTDPGRSIYLQYTGALNSDCTVTIGPNTVSKLWFIENATTDSGSSGPYNIIIKQGSGATVTIRNGQVKAIYSDGAGSGGKMVDAFTNLNVKNLITEQAGNTTGLQLISTDADAAVGPRLDLSRLSASPADDDAAGQIRFMANNDAGTETSFGFIRMLLSDVSDGSEDAKLEIDTRVAGTNRSRIEISSTETVFNQDSQDIDLRVETDGNANMVFVEGSTNRVGIGTSSPSTELEVAGDITAISAGPSIFLTDSDNNPDYQIKNGNGTFRIIDATNSQDRINCDSTETIINESSADLDFRVESNGVTDALKVDGGNDQVIIGTGADLLTSSAGSDNIRIGEGAGNSIASGGTSNIAIGKNAGTAISTGDFNIAIGQDALKTEDGHGGNIAIGYEALETQNAGANAFSVAVGHQAGKAITTAVNNVAIGGLALKSGTTGGNNVIIGYAAGDAMTTGNTNVAIGSAALGTNVEGDRNVAVGYQALKTFNPSSDSDTYNIAIGYNAGLSQTTSTNNIFIGGLAGDANTTGGSNVAIGRSSLGADTTGIQSTAVGRGALQAQNFTGSEETGNTAVGYNAANDITTGIRNTIVGAQAADALTDADDNVAFGYLALTSDRKGNKTTAIGRGALGSQDFSGSTDSHNTAVGYFAGQQLTTATNTTILGSLAGDAITTANNNTCLGYAAGSAISTGAKNTVVGSIAGDSMQTGEENTLVGYSAGGNQNITGDGNTAVGVRAGDNLTSGSNNLLLGNAAGLTGSPGGNINSESNEIVLGDENISEAHIQVSLTVASDERDKTDFVDLDLGLDFVKGLEPVTYYWDKRSKYGDKSADDYDLNAQTPDGTHKEDWMDIGFKAQAVRDLEEAAGYKASDKKNLTVSLSGDGKQYGLQYEKFIPILVKAIKDQDAIITSLTSRVAALES